MFGWLRRLQLERAACRLARAAFDREHPEGRSWGARVVANEVDRRVVRVYCGDGLPWLAHYAVPNLAAADPELLAEDWPYRPRMWP